AGRRSSRCAAGTRGARSGATRNTARSPDPAQTAMSWYQVGARYRDVSRSADALDLGPVGAQVVGDHALGREALLDVAAALHGLEEIGLLERGGHGAVVVDDDPTAAVLDHLRHGPPPRGDHRRAAGHRLDHHEAEGLLPLDREQRRARVLEQLDLLAVRDLAEVFDLFVEVGLDELVEVVLLLEILLLPRELQR